MKKISLLGLIVIIGCTTRSQIKDDTARVEKALESEISLKSDRSRLDELRADIPKDKQETNDELALFLQLMGNESDAPATVRSKFQALVEKRRNSFRGKVARLRDEYKNEETRAREKFLEEQKKKRANFVSKRHDSATSRQFFADQEKERLSFFADARDRRSNFESEVSAQSKDFESYMRERMHEFNEQHRLYTKAYNDRRNDAANSRAAAKGSPVSGSGPNEFQQMNGVEATPLGTAEGQ